MSSGPVAGRPADILTGLLDAPLRAAGFDLEDVSVRRVGGQSVVAVTVDRDGSLDLDAIADASRIVSDALDARESDLPGPLQDAYTLEVSSRGADAPLVTPRHWQRAVGRLVEARLRDRGTVRGRVSSAGPEEAALLVEPKPHKPGAKVSSKAPTKTTVAYADVVRATIELEFTHGDDLDDPDGFDEITPDQGKNR